MKKQLLFILMMVLPMVAWADDSGTCGNNLTWTYNESTKTLSIEGSGDMWNYSYESQLPWYYYRSIIETIIIGDGAMSIGENAFRGCPHVTSVTIGNGVLFIGTFAFAGCSSLVSVTIPNSVTSIGNNAFGGCSSLASVIIGIGVTSIGNNAFGGCSSLTSVTISNSVTNIENSVFADCTSLASVIIGNGVTTMGNNVFSNCTSLASVTIGNKVTSIGDYTFANCSSLSSVTIPNSVTNIGRQAFSNCSALSSIIIGNNVKNIGMAAFANCSSLTSVDIPKSVMGIAYNAFYGCLSLSSITVDAENTRYDSRENCNAIIRTESNQLTLGCKNTFIPNSVTTIGSCAFAGSSITSIVIPNSVTEIYSGAFEGCESLTSVTLPNSLTRIYDSAFAGSGLISVVIPASVKTLDNYMFSGCNSLSSIKVEDGNKTYDSRENCNGIVSTLDNCLVVGCKSTLIPNSVTSIGRYAFVGCGSLTSITLPNSVTTICDCAFQNCGLSTIVLPENLKVIESLAFERTNLSSITLPYSLEKLGQACFSGCKLENVIIKNSNTVIEVSGANSFSNPTYQHAILYVPAGHRWDAIYGNGGWYRFNNIREIAMESRELSEARAYTLMNTNDFSLAVYDAVNGEVANASSLYDIDENNASNAWQIIKGDDDNYLYNIGARQYAGIDADGKIVLSSSPVAISLHETKNGFTLGDNNGQQWGFVINENVKPYKDLSAIDNITSTAIRDAYYTLDGQRLSQVKKGLNIVRTSDGQAKKVIIK